MSLHECRAVLLPGYHMARTGSRENVEEMNSSPAVLIQHTGHTVGSLSAVICVEIDDFCKGRKVFTII